jgi:hypothetical protein
LYGRPDVWIIHDEWGPTAETLATLDDLTKWAFEATGFPQSMAHCDFAAGPDIAKEVLMTRVRGKFCIAEELTKNPPY